MESSAAEGITVDPEFIAGVQLGIGCFNLVIYLSVHLSITTVCLFVTSSYPFIHQIQLSIHSSDPIIHPFITTVYSSIHHIQLSIHPSHPVIHPFVTSSYPSIRHIQLSIHSSHPVIHPFITSSYPSIYNNCLFIPFLSVHSYIHSSIYSTDDLLTSSTYSKTIGICWILRQSIIRSARTLTRCSQYDHSFSYVYNLSSLLSHSSHRNIR